MIQYDCMKSFGMGDLEDTTPKLRGAIKEPFLFSFIWVVQIVNTIHSEGND